MKVVFYTMFGGIFKPICDACGKALGRRGVDCGIVVLPSNFKGVLPDAEADVNIHILGCSQARVIGETGFPASGINVGWVFEPLVSDATISAIHARKYTAIMKVIDRCDGVIAMHDVIHAAITRLLPGVPSCIIPTMMSEGAIKPIFSDSERGLDVLALQTKTARRTAMVEQVRGDGLPLIELNGIFYPWTTDLLTRCRLSLNIHPDEHKHFAQSRFIDAWAAGVPVVSEPFPNWERYGLEDGKNCVMAEVEDMAGTCRALLADPVKRMAIAEAGQAVLRERYVASVWADRMYEFLSGVCSVEPAQVA